MAKVIVFGTGSMAKRYVHRAMLDPQIDLMAVTSSSRPVDYHTLAIPWISILNMDNLSYDYIVICTSFYHEVVPDLLNAGIDIKKIRFCGELSSALISSPDLNIDVKPGQYKGLQPRVALLSRHRSGCNAFHFKRYLDKVPDVGFSYELVGIDELRERESEFDWLVSTNAEGRLFNFLLNIETWHGFPIKNIGYLEKNSNDDFEEMNRKINLVASYSDIYKYAFSCAFGIDMGKFATIGMPRNDVFFEEKDLLPHSTPNPFLDGNNVRYMVWMPTFRSRHGKEIPDGTYPLADRHGVENLACACRQLGVNLIIKLHPFDSEASKLREMGIEGVHLIFDDDLKAHNIDFYDILAGAEAVITDYSSVAYDFLLTLKPIIYFQPDFNLYSLNRNFCFSDLDLFFPGPRSFDYKQLCNDVVDIFYNDRWAGARERLLNLIHSNKSGGYSEKLLSVIEGFCNERN